MKRILAYKGIFIYLCMSVAFVASASQPASVPDLIGPAPASGQKQGQIGLLQVHSATEDHYDGEVHYYPHTPYTIYGSDGKQIKYVQNHTGTMDEKAALVPLEPGIYRIVARSETQGRVSLKVLIKPRRTTEVFLERNSKLQTPKDGSGLVKMSDGEAVGWRAEATSQSVVK